MKALVVGAGVTGCFTAARLLDKGIDAALLARGEKADRLERDGLRLRDGIDDAERTVSVPIVRAPVEQAFDVALVCVQQTHRASVVPLLSALPGQPLVWFLGNTTKGFDALGTSLGRERVLGGFPGVGGTWAGEVLVYADRERPTDPPFDRLVVGEAFPEAAPRVDEVRGPLSAAGMHVEHYAPIMAWHWTHVALILPLAGAVYRHAGDVDRVASDTALLRQAMRGTRQAFQVVRRAGYPILPKSLSVMRWVPAFLGAGKIGALLTSKFGRIALVGHARTAQKEMQSLAADLLELAGDASVPDLRALMASI